MEKAEIKEVVEETIKILKEKGFLYTGFEYEDISKIMHQYYENGEKDERLRRCIKNIHNDRYFDIIPLYFKEKKTIEYIAEKLKVDSSTIVRNKKRLCRSIYIQYK
ncbi:MAG: hypothetical protein K2N51_01230 [Lachnospiraceae bacterium]|nr:hypothetical protein [Lachnospiraceae bacterium]